MCPYVHGAHTWVLLAVEILVLQGGVGEVPSVLETNAVFFCIDHVLSLFRVKLDWKLLSESSILGLNQLY